MDPQPKATPWKVIIPVAIVIILCCLCLVVAGVLGYLGTQGKGPLSMLATATPTPRPTPTPYPTPTLAPTAAINVIGEWDMYYDWSCASSYSGPALVTFFFDQSFTLNEDDFTGYGTWYTNGDTLDFIFNNSPFAHYTGVMDYSSTYVEGTISTDDGSSGCWYATKR